MGSQRHHWTDEQILHGLHMIEVRGMSCARAAAEISAQFGIDATKNSMIGVTNRVNTAANREGCLCMKPENRDGGMPPAWWVRR